MIKDAIKETADLAKTNEINETISKLDFKGNISDGSHTFDELYFHRMILTAALCKAYHKNAWKSKLHDDGTMFDNYFIVGFNTPEGSYTYHYHMEHFDYFKDIKELEKAPVYDGHKPEDVTRLLSLKDEWLEDFYGYHGG